MRDALTALTCFAALLVIAVAVCVMVIVLAELYSDMRRRHSRSWQPSPAGGHSLTGASGERSVETCQEQACRLTTGSSRRSRVSHIG